MTKNTPNLNMFLEEFPLHKEENSKTKLTKILNEEFQQQDQFEN